jgi:hypothetical protein
LGGIVLAAWIVQSRNQVPFAMQDHGSLRVMPGARLPEQNDAGRMLQGPLLKAAAISMRLPSLLGSEESQPGAAPPSQKASPSPKHQRSDKANEPPTGHDTRARRPKAVATAKLAAVPERSAVIAAMKRITPAVERCFGAAHGVVKVSMFVRGQTGKVTMAHVTGLSGKPGSCIATVVRGVSLPPFQKAQLEIGYPFSH